MTLYDTLGVAKNATAEEIRQAFKKLAKKFHPDANPGNPSTEAKFKEISAAYNVIGDQQKRAAYDRDLERPQGGYGFPGFEGFEGFEGFNFTFDPFEALRNSTQQLNVIAKVKLAFLDPKHDHNKNIKFIRRNLCKICNGSGAKTFSGNCGACHGKGFVRTSSLGFLTTVQPCNLCNGQGKHIKDSCGNCQKGFNEEPIDVNVGIPAGIMHGKILRVVGEGHRTQKGAGDLLIQVEITEDPRWERQHANVISKLLIDYPTLVLGGEVEVETIWGKEKIKIPAGTRVGTVMPLYNKGFPRLHGLIPSECGVHSLILDLNVPSISSTRYNELLREMKKIHETGV